MEKNSYKLAKKYIKKELMTKSLLKKFYEHGLENRLEGIYLRSAELLEDNKDANRALQSHLGRILPCIAFYEALIEQEGNKEKALEIYGKWSLCGMEKAEKFIQRAMKLPGLYKWTPSIFDKMIDKLFGTNAGFESKRVGNAEGFARDMVVCPYALTCKKYGYPEIARFFCDADDISYGNMHPKLVWVRTKTIGRGDEFCDFRLYVKKKIVIKKAEKNDLEEILKLQYLAYQSEAKLFNNTEIPPLKQTLEELLIEFQRGIILKVLSERNEIIGSVRAYREEDSVYIGKLIVHPDRHREGIGTRLLLEIEKEYPAQRYELFTSSKSERNIALYQQLGYDIYKEKKITEELKLIYLQKECGAELKHVLGGTTE